MFTVAAYLWLCTIGENAGRYCTGYPFQSLQECYNSIEHSAFGTANGGDIQANSVLFCSPTRDGLMMNNGQVVLPLVQK